MRARQTVRNVRSDHGRDGRDPCRHVGGEEASAGTHNSSSTNATRFVPPGRRSRLVPYISEQQGDRSTCKAINAAGERKKTREKRRQKRRKWHEGTRRPTTSLTVMLRQRTLTAAKQPIATAPKSHDTFLRQSSTDRTAFVAIDTEIRTGKLRHAISGIGL